MRRSLLLVALALACAVVAACGEEARDERLTREEFIRQADAICAAHERRLAELPTPRSVAELADVAEEALPIAREGIARLRALKPPVDLAPLVAEWLLRNEANVKRMEELRDAARAGDETEVQEIASAATDNEREADALARRIGLDDCAAEE